MLLGELSKVLGPLPSLCSSHCHSHISGHRELRGTEVIQFHVQFINDRYVLLGWVEVGLSEPYQQDEDRYSHGLCPEDSKGFQSNLGTLGGIFMGFHEVLYLSNLFGLNTILYMPRVIPPLHAYWGRFVKTSDHQGITSLLETLEMLGKHFLMQAQPNERFKWKKAEASNPQGCLASSSLLRLGRCSGSQPIVLWPRWSSYRQTQRLMWTGNLTASFYSMGALFSPVSIYCFRDVVLSQGQSKADYKVESYSVIGRDSVVLKRWEFLLLR